jgi:hypothetical protein
MSMIPHDAVCFEAVLRRGFGRKGLVGKYGSAKKYGVLYKSSSVCIYALFKSRVLSGISGGKGIFILADCVFRRVWQTSRTVLHNSWCVFCSLEGEIAIAPENLASSSSTAPVWTL